jgi:uncharacterized membrane protein (DUF485 family)
MTSPLGRSQPFRSSEPTVHTARETGDRAATAQARARAHWHVALGILAVNGGLYLTLILLIAYQKTLLGWTPIPGLSLAIILGSIVTIAAWLLTLVYVRWANASDHAPGAD